MKWLDKLERKYGKYAIPNLMYYVIILYIIGFVIDIVSPQLYTDYLALDANAILHGQIWRIFTFIIQPPNSSYFFILFALYLYYMIGKTLEYMWGAFRFNLYFFSGMLLHVIACLLIYLIFGMNFQMGSFYLNMSLFFVYVALFPDTEFLLFFIIPIKAKWLGYIYILLNVVEIVQYAQTGDYRGYMRMLLIVAALLDFVIFYAIAREPHLGMRMKQAKKRRVIYKNTAQQAGQPRHKCAICGRTELDDPNLVFRYCSKCEGNYEYCQDHLFTHKHVKRMN